MKTLLLIMLMLLFAVGVNSQTSEKKWSVGIGAGAYKVLDKNDVGFLPELILNRYLSPRFDLALKGDVGLFRSDLYSELDLVMGSLNLRLKLTDGTGKLRPYIFAGPGYLWDNNQADFNFNVGLGTKYYLGPSTALYAQLGYVNGIDIIRDQKPVYDKFFKLSVGIAFDFGKAKAEEVTYTPASVVQPLKAEFTPDVRFTIVSPSNIPIERRVRETFPLCNYVFFNEGSSEIPDRYILLQKNEVANFKEDQLEVLKPKKLSGRSDRQMNVYYNILNILGDRMQKNPSSVVRLAGASMEGSDDGKLIAESTKTYLVTVFGINESRINTEGRIKPRIPSEQPGGTLELGLLREGDRRVSIWSESPSILQEFQSGPENQLKPVEIMALQVAPIDSYVSFNAEGSDKAYTSWSMEIADENGKVQNFGPYTKETVTIPGKSILGTNPKGDFKVTMIGITKNGNTQTKKSNMKMVLWTPAEREQGMRYSVNYEFNESKVKPLYEKYLAEIVSPKIPKNGTVIIHGHTDIIGEEAYNLQLSQERANDVKVILENALIKAGRNDVKFEVHGFGENDAMAAFDNNFPEERFYNRNVIMDIIPPR
jgi:outer membrane protein OmpA-like peptidoglycan-associated protein